MGGSGAKKVRPGGKHRGLHHVVTCFLMRRGKVLVLRRSRRVGTYKGKWAGVSGYIEPGESPFETACKEIKEETGLSGARVTLLAVGKPLRVSGTPFVVHPFLFEVERGRVRIDWEHSASRWIRPEEMRRLETVPGLGAAFERVRPG